MTVRGWKKFLGSTGHIMLKFVHFGVHMRMLVTVRSFSVHCTVI